MDWMFARWLADISQSLHRLHAKTNVILDQLGAEMADLSQLQADVGNLNVEQQAAVGELQRLDQLVSGLQAGTVTQQQIDALDAQVSSVSSALAGAVQSSQGAVPPPSPIAVPPPPPAPEPVPAPEPAPAPAPEPGVGDNPAPPSATQP